MPRDQQPPTKVRALTDAIVSDIARGRLRSGDRVDSERQLAARFEVSLGTVQKALQALQHRGVIDRQHGRGSFVRGLGASVDTRYLRFHDARGQPLPVRWHILHHAADRGDARLKAFFRASPALVRIDRSVDVGGRFTLLSQLFLRRTDFDALFRDEPPRDDTNIREMIASKLALPTVRVEQHMGFDRMRANVAKLLGAAAGGPCFTIELRGYTVQDRPLSLQRVYGEPFRQATLVVDTKNP